MQCGATAYHSVAKETQNYNLLPYKSLVTFTRGKPATKERAPGFWELSLFWEREFVEFCVLFQSAEWLSSLGRGHQKRWEKDISYTGFSRNKLNPDTAIFHDMSVEQVLYGHVKGLLKENVSVKQVLLASFEKLFVSLCDHSRIARALSKAERFSLGSLVKAAPQRTFTQRWIWRTDGISFGPADSHAHSAHSGPCTLCNCLFTLSIEGLLNLFLSPTLTDFLLLNFIVRSWHDLLAFMVFFRHSVIPWWLKYVIVSRRSLNLLDGCGIKDGRFWETPFLTDFQRKWPLVLWRRQLMGILTACSWDFLSRLPYLVAADWLSQS